MSETVAIAAKPGGAPAVAKGASVRFAGPPEALWAACIGAQVAIAAVLTRYTYFFFDDFLFLRQAQTQGFGRAYLTEPLFTHFSPVTRVLNKLLTRIDPGSFAFAHGVQLALYACAIAAFAFVVRTILGRSWLAFGLTVLFGQSVFLLRLLNWWTATANLLPATIFMLLALGCYLRWHEGGNRRWLIASLVAFAVSLLDYETAMLFPAYLVMIRLLILDDRLDPRHWVGTLWRERWSWLAFFALDAAALVNYYAKYYTSFPRPTAGQLVHFTEISLVQSFTPAIFGVARQPTPGTGAVVATGLCFVALAAIVVYLRPRVWRCLAVAFLAFLLSLWPLGLNRIHLFGVYVGAELYYQQSAQFMFLVLMAFALGPRFRGPRSAPAPFKRVPAIVLTVAGLAVAAGYGALYVSSVDALANASWEPRVSKSYFHKFLGDVARYRAATGRDPNLIDSTVGTNLMAANFAPFNRYSWFFPVITSHLQYNQTGRDAFVVSPMGALEPVRFTPQASAVLRGPLCAPGGAITRARFRLNRVVRVGGSSGGAATAITVAFTLPTTADVVIRTFGPGNRAPQRVGDGHTWGPGHGSGLAVVDNPRAIAGGDVLLPRGGCVTQLVLGSYVPTRG